MVNLKNIKRGILGIPRYFLIRLPVYILVNLFSSGKHFSLVARLLTLHCFLFGHMIRKYYISETACFLSRKIIGFENDNFIPRYLLNKLMSSYIQQMMVKHPWRSAYNLLSQCHCEKTKHDLHQVKLFLCTHTGDYWLLILNIARQLCHTNRTLIVPIYQKITPQDLEVYRKIGFEGVRVQFVNIHEKRSLLNLIRWLKNDDYVVAIFYDLACYIGGVYNGSVRPVTLFNKKAFITTGILSLADKLDIQASLVSCNYNEQEKNYCINFSESFNASLENEHRLVTGLEKHLACFPYQWHFINNIDCYYHYPYSIISGHYRRLTEQYQGLSAKYQGNG